MTDYNPESASVLTAVRDAFEGVTMPTPLGTLVAEAGARRRRRRVIAACSVTAVVAIAALAVGTAGPAQHPAQSATGTTATSAQPVHIVTAAYTVDSQSDGTVTVTWTKQAYIADPAGLQAALHAAGFPVLVKVGEFCRGPNDDGYLNPSGQGRGIDDVIQARTDSDGQVVFTFNRAALPANTELFIGYLSPAQLAVTRGRPGSVERLVPTDATLVCTTQAPPAHP